MSLIGQFSSYLAIISEEASEFTQIDTFENLLVHFNPLKVQSLLYVQCPSALSNCAFCPEYICVFATVLTEKQHLLPFTTLNGWPLQWRLTLFTVMQDPIITYYLGEIPASQVAALECVMYLFIYCYRFPYLILCFDI